MAVPLAYWVKTKRVWFSILALVITAAGAGIYKSLSTIQNLSDLEARLSEMQLVSSTLFHFHATLLALESAQRGYLYTQDEAYLVDFDSNMRQLLKHTDTLHSGLRSNSIENSDLDAMLAYAALKRSEIAESVALLKEGKAALADASMSNYEGLLLYTNIKRHYMAYASLLDKRQAELTLAVAEGRKDSRMTFLVSSIITTVLVIMLLSMIYLAVSLYQRQQQQQSEAKDRFLAHLGHELRTPLTSILGYSELLLNTENNARVKSHMTTVVRNAQHLQTLINDLLDLSTLVAGKMRLNIQQCNLHQLLDDIHASMGIVAEEKGLSLRVRSTSAIPTMVNIDPTRVKQILINLINNAVKFTAEGNIQLVVTCAGKRSLIFTVKDTGCGIPEDKLTSIFKPFEQASSYAVNQGVGLGLAISHQLVEKMDGTIVVSSNETGSTFEVCIQCADDFSDDYGHYRFKKSQHNLSHEHQTALAGTVLVVDDNPDIRRLTENMLTQMGICAALAQSGEQALIYLKNNHVDLILMDLHMPSMSGQDTLRSLRDANINTPVVAITAGLAEGMEKQLLAVGFDSVLGKPIETQSLYAVCQRHCKKDVLVIEDDPDSGALLCLLLRAKGITVTHVTSANAAQEAIRKSVPTHVICDVNLPDNDGLSLIRTIASDFPSINIYLVSGHAISQELAHQSGAKAAYLKPIANKDIENMLA
ncbi:response regulator [Alteromonas sediminis]|uniref:histidine kinase n=1 Tax=Alteromonas sediminis TaxID=2259342 RepID=A0A3N5ZBX8_9ALTE|nr:response regulator [Alteromonas sediminis]RPJ67238.1 response regulator [Alteromonas sediminis]